ncbi:sigma-70 family RNA polymerase sigma factor [Saccharibacillus deserti]|uniref:sigma-70 family RNA polymerase sigma factor n=1 Tax=Saccharibacillus deserti TaxID=1634444 RepID=UPI001FE38E7D|nr:sigma-70 family RNA polymerase sigma factor [Saccharibacillus deserti]
MVKGVSHLDLIDRLKNQEESALRELMDGYGDLLLRTASLLVRDRQTAEEAVQDAFVQAYLKIGQLHDSAKLKSWLIRIVVNRCRMRQRTWSWRHLLPGGMPGDLPADPATVSAGADDIVMAHWEQGRLAEAVGRLDYPYRESVVLYYFDELSIKEIAELLESGENTVKSRLARGRRMLKRILEKEEPT